MLSGFEKALLALLLFVLMMGMGATLTWKDFSSILRRPRGVIIGLLSQFGWMPLIAFGLAVSLGLSDVAAISLIIVGSTPGGTTSNLFTYYSRADLPLSISMTVASSISAVVIMPLILMLYTPRFTSQSLSLPYGNIASTLAIVLIPLAIGMALKKKNEALAARIEKAGSYSGIAVLLLLIATGVIGNSAFFSRITVGGYVSAIGLGLLGMILGYAAASAAGLPHPSRRAVSLETGIQNSPLAIGVIALSFPDSVHEEALLLPLLYALFVLVNATFVTLWFRQQREVASS